jgi:tetratricopeptide (TPR) repeat protein
VGLALAWSMRRRVFALPIVRRLWERIQVAEAVRSGTALAILTGTALLLVQAGWMALLLESSTVLQAPFRAGMAAEPRILAQVAMRAGDYRTAVRRLYLSRERLGKPDGPWLQGQALYSALVLGDAWRAQGDRERAKAAYEEALQLARALVTSVGSPESAQLEAVVRAALESLADDPTQRTAPRAGALPPG